ncbi:MAG TPA: C40 family peptidase [Burkholderiales bacterium]|nr:C40 family peptidase [Burkholderiales bacterium]
MKRTFLIMTVIALLTTHAQAEESVSPEKPTRESAFQTARAAASELILNAMSLLGVNYKYGGDSPETGFDCSGFVTHVFKESADITLPRSAHEMSLVGQRVSTKELQPGDLVFYNTLRRAFSHVGIYIGDDKFIHSPSGGRTVEIVDMNEKYWLKRYQGARRITQLDQDTGSGFSFAAPASKPDAELLSILH